MKKILAAVFILLSLSACNISQKTTPLNEVNVPLGETTPTAQTYNNISDFSFEEMFSYRDPKILPKKEDGKYILVVTGDVLTARSTNNKMVTKNNFLYPFEKTADFLNQGDLTYINLETPIFAGCPATTEGMIFCGDGRAVEGLVYAGVDVVNLANNHFGNHGEEGRNQTVKILTEKKMTVVGNHAPAVVQTKAKKFGFLGYNDIGYQEEGISWADISTIQKEIKELKPQVDFLIVQFHWGIEYVSDPSDRQKELGRTAIDAGADLVIGNHPHWVQGVEIYSDKLITYSHGNFVFDQMWSQETREGVVGVYTFNDQFLESVNYYPVIIEDYAQPRFASEQEALKILQRMKASTEKIASMK